jgi:hypothetical protein
MKAINPAAIVDDDGVEAAMKAKMEEMRKSIFSGIRNAPINLDDDEDGSLKAPRVNRTSPIAPPVPTASWGAPQGSPCSLDLTWGEGLVFCEPDLVRG